MGRRRILRSIDVGFKFILFWSDSVIGMLYTIWTQAGSYSSAPVLY